MRFPLDRIWLPSLLVFVAVVAIGVTSTWAAEEPKAEEPAKPAEEPKVEEPKAKEPKAEEPAPEPDPFAVPEGTPGELLKYIDGLKTVRPKAFDQDSITEFRKKLAGALVKASDKIIVGEPDDDQAGGAVQYKLTGLRMLGGLGDAEAAKKIEDLPAELEKAGLGKFKRMVESYLLQNRLQDSLRAGPDEFEKMLGEVKQFIVDGGAQPDDARLAMTAGRMAEMTGVAELAGNTYRELGTIFAASDNEQIAAFGKKMQGAARRVTLVGNAMEIDGPTLDGTPFDWSQYEGKVVLIDFWATWCGYCIREFPNMKKNYEVYKDRGFEIIGINTDDSRERLDAYLEKDPLPWAIVVDRTPDPDEKRETLGTRYGIFGIPSMMLIGRDGKVITLRARGQALDKALESLIGPVEEEKPEDDAAAEEEAKPEDAAAEEEAKPDDAAAEQKEEKPDDAAAEEKEEKPAEAKKVEETPEKSE